MNISETRGRLSAAAIISRQSALFSPALILFFLCLFPFRLFSQYYPAPAPVPSIQLRLLLNQERSVSTAHQHIQVLNALSNLYFNLPLKKPGDLTLSKKYAQRALDGSIKAQDEGGKSYALLMLGQNYGYTGDLASAEKLLSPADKPTGAKLLLQLSYFAWNLASDDKSQYYDKCLAYARRASVISKDLGLTDLSLIARLNIGLTHSSQKYPGAEAELGKLLADYQRAGNKKLHYVYYPLAWYLSTTGNPDKAYYYAQAAITSVNATRDSLAAGDINTLKAYLLFHQERYREAIQTARLSLKYYSRYSGMYNVFSPEIYNFIGAAYDKMGKKTEAINYTLSMMKKYPPKTKSDSVSYFSRIGHAYRESKQFQLSEHYFRRVYAIRLLAGDGLMDANINLGQLYLDWRQYAKARPFLYKVLSSPEFAAMRTSGQRHLHYMLFLVDSATHHYLSAIKHRNFLNDQATIEARLEKDKVVKKMEVAYKALEKEQQIRLKNQNILLLKRDARTQLEKLKQSQMIIFLTVGGLLLALVIVLLLFFLYRQKQRSTKKISRKNKLLEKLLSEKEWLLKEVHHRVKNNLHTIFCLLESQARTASGDARSALENSKMRVYAMSLFHQKVYQSRDIEQVEFGLYLRDFLVFMQDNFDLESRNIRIVHDLGSVSLPLKQAMPLALVVNEALTNAVKYAFKGRSSGEIKLSLTDHGKKYLLTLSDNGIGMRDTGLSGNSSLGMELMHGLCADIEADIRFDVRDGTRISITFVAEQEVKKQKELQIV